MKSEEVMMKGRHVERPEEGFDGMPYFDPGNELLLAIIMLAEPVEDGPAQSVPIEGEDEVPEVAVISDHDDFDWAEEQHGGDYNVAYYIINI